MSYHKRSLRGPFVTYSWMTYLLEKIKINWHSSKRPPHPPPPHPPSWRPGYEEHTSPLSRRQQMVKQSLWPSSANFDFTASIIESCPTIFLFESLVCRLSLCSPKKKDHPQALKKNKMVVVTTINSFAIVVDKLFPLNRSILFLFLFSFRPSRQNFILPSERKIGNSFPNFSFFHFFYWSSNQTFANCSSYLFFGGGGLFPGTGSNLRPTEGGNVDEMRLLGEPGLSLTTRAKPKSATTTDISPESYMKSKRRSFMD